MTPRSVKRARILTDRQDTRAWRKTTRRKRVRLAAREAQLRADVARAFGIPEELL